ncbi:zinc-dependent alcohol dehydrogenase family protein [Cupriavidus basilensis]|uniref:zinc-dependent alcohol dehydrogenase family protein n=1 Tax=Cupriavidus basilensis TaxID=68895 RepID=UPI001F3F4274|nr:NAD(P)-dependent alcohol dehydrogenase [Cupriavidus basilensis]
MDNVKMATRTRPTPGPGQVRVRMSAAALNYRDLIIPMRGYGRRMQDLPLILLSDGVGIVDAMGDGVSSVALGDRVCPIFYQTWLAGKPSNETMLSSLGCEQDGTMSDYMVLPAEGVCHVPSHLSDFEAATLPTAAVTSWRALVTEGGLKGGDRVLLQGTGGVSLFALQFAKSLGAHVIITSSSDKKLARARELGADETINYTTDPQWGRSVKAMTDEAGVDHVIEVGGAGTLEQSLRAVRTGGTISMIGVLSGSEPRIPLGQVVTRHVRLQGITVGSRADFESMSAHIAGQRLRPVVDSVFPFEALRDAMDYLVTGQHFGKICISHAGQMANN